MKKNGNQYRKYRPILGCFITGGAFYFLRRGGRGEAGQFLSFFFSRSYLQEVLFFHNITLCGFFLTSKYIHTLLSQPTPHTFGKFRVIDLGTYSNTCNTLTPWINWFQNNSKCALNVLQAIITLHYFTLTMEQLAFSVLDSKLCWNRGGNN